MKGRVHATNRRLIGITISGAMLLGALPGSPVAGAEPVSSLPPCGVVAPTAAGDGMMVAPWHAVLDAEGAVTGHQLTMRHAGREQALRTGRRGFASALAVDRLLVGERGGSGTRLDMIDLRRACRLWSRELEVHAYPERDRGDGRVRLAVHDRASRDYLGERLLDPESGATEATVEGVCLEGCYPSDGDLGPAALEPAGAARPTPNFAAGGWAKGKTLAFRWRAGAVPPSWARTPLKAAGDDAQRTSYARSPRFPYRSDAPSAVAYTSALPGFCSDRAIACAGRSMPSSWGAWIRPYGTDFAWGTLRWCQKISSASGCFDLRRVALHELGHIVGLDHPSSAGFSLSSSDSIMQGITPARPQPGASRHAFGRCDVATLQELYDTTDNKTAISTCNDVATGLTLSASRSSVARGGSVTLTAQLKVASRSAYRQLSGNPLNGRSLKLKYRAVGGSGAWKTAWMRSLYSSGRYELSIKPGTTWEFKAVFPTPDDEGLRYSRSASRKVKVVE